MAPQRKLSDTTLAIIIIAAILIVVVAASITIALLVGPSCNQQPADPPPQSGIGFDPSAGDYVEQVQGSANSKPNVEVKGFGQLTIPPNTKDNINIDLHNPEANAGYYNMTFEIRYPNPDAENGYEVLYKSGLVAPGQHIQKISLSKSFEPGTYECYLFVQPYDVNDQSIQLNNANLKFELIVK